MTYDRTDKFKKNQTMKKNILSIICAAAAMTAAVSCANKENSEPETPSRVPMQFTAGTPAVTVSGAARNAASAGTRTAIAADGKSAVWSEGDAIGIFDTKANKFDIIEGAGTSTGRFSGFALPDTPLYAFYPYDETVSVSGSILSATLPSEQYSTADATFDTMLNPAVAIPGADNSLAFDHVAAMFKVILEGVTGDVKSIALSADKSLAGAYTVDMSAETYSAAAASSDTPAGVSLVGKDGGNLAAGPYYIVILPGSYTDMTLTVTLADGTSAMAEISSLTVEARDIKEAVIPVGEFTHGDFGFAQTEDTNFSYKGSTKTYTVNAPAGTSWTLTADSEDVTLSDEEGTGTRTVTVTLPYSKYIYDKSYTLTLSADGQESRTMTITQDSFGYPDLHENSSIEGNTLTSAGANALIHTNDKFTYGTFEWTFSNVNLNGGYFCIDNTNDGITLRIRFGGTGNSGENFLYGEGSLQIGDRKVFFGADSGWNGGYNAKSTFTPSIAVNELRSLKLEILPDEMDNPQGAPQTKRLSRKIWVNGDLVLDNSETRTVGTNDGVGGDIWQAGSSHQGLEYQFGISGGATGSITIESFEHIPYDAE